MLSAIRICFIIHENSCKLFVHFYEFFDVLSAVAETWYLVLSAKLALCFQPFVEESRFCRDDFEWLEGYVFEALCLVVRVDGLERTVEYGSKLFY